jgi:hypothetical protein
MDAKELRIGNLVEEPKGYTHKIERLDEKSDRVRHGIKITNEWLINLGFRKTFSSLLFLPMPSISSEIHYEKHPYGKVFTIRSSAGVLVPNDIKYIHQLQNLYFALTGEELIAINN